MRLVPLVACAAIPFLPRVALAEDAHDCAVESFPDAAAGDVQLLRSSPPGATPVTVYLNGGGAALSAGMDDSSTDTSSLVYRHGVEALRVPAYRGGADAWAEVVGCVRDKLSAFAVDVVDERPQGGEYIMAVVGGEPDLLGYGRGVSGVAPWSGRVMPAAVVYVFEREMDGHAGAVCNAAVHEVGHALGLEHEYLCEDPMSYLSGCGEKTFQDVDAWCGEFSARECAGGGAQNSYRHLAQAVGLRGGEVDEKDDTDPTGEDRETPEAPDITILSTDTRDDGRGARVIDLVVEARGARRLAKLELAWATPTRSYLLSCAAIPRGLPATCRRRGDRFAFSLRVGDGKRAFAVRATDVEGFASVSDVHTLWLGGR